MTLPDYFQDQVKASKPRKPRKVEDEGAIKDGVKKILAEEAPEAWYYMPVQSAYGTHGIPDFVACVPVTIRPEMVGQTFGLFVTIETKAGDNELSPNQGTVNREIAESHGFNHITKGRTGLKTLRHWFRRLYGRAKA
jgi:hypothetical protein